MGLVQALRVSKEGQQKATSLHPYKTSENTLTYNCIPPRTWPNSITSFYNTLSSFHIANSSFISHSLVAPGTRRVLADQHNTPETSVKMYANVPTKPQYYSIVYITLRWGMGGIWFQVLCST